MHLSIWICSKEVYKQTKSAVRVLDRPLQQLTFIYKESSQSLSRTDRPHNIGIFVLLFMRLIYAGSFEFNNLIQGNKRVLLFVDIIAKAAPSQEF